MFVSEKQSIYIERVLDVFSRNIAPLNILQQDDLSRIHEASVKVLQQTGMVFHKREVLELFEKHGARISGKTVYFTKDLIENALKTCPSKFTWRARNKEKSIEVGKGLYAQAGGGSTNIQDLEKGKRKSTLNDFINIQKLYQSSKVIDVVGFTPVDAGDVAADYKHLYMQYEILKHTDKPVHGHVSGGRQAGEMLDMIEIAFGEKDLLQKHHVMGLSINTISPLGFGEEQLDTLIEYVNRNQIIIACPMAIGGASAPISHVGITVLVNAEILAMITLIQLLNPGNPVIIGPSSSFADMKTGAYSAGIPDGMLHILTQIQLSKDYYNLPARVLSGACDAKSVDAQAGYETMQNLMISALGGADILAHACGVLDGIMTISYEKMMIDEELIRRAKYFRERSVEISDEALAVDIINEVGPEGTFMLHQSVFDNCRSLFQASVSDWSNYAEWVNKGGRDVVEVAGDLYKERLAAAPLSLLGDDALREIENYMAKIVDQ